MKRIIFENFLVNIEKEFKNKKIFEFKIYFTGNLVKKIDLIEIIKPKRIFNSLDNKCGI